VPGAPDRRERRGEPSGQLPPAGEVAQRHDHGAVAPRRGAAGELQRPGGVGADPHRRGRAGRREPRRRLLVAQDEQVGGAHDRARQPAGRRAVEVARPDADQSERAPHRLHRARHRRRAGEQRERRPPARRMQALEDRPAGEDDGVRAADGPQHRRGVVPGHRGDAVLARGRRRLRGRRGQPRARQRAGERREQRLVARVALAERAGQQHAGVHGRHAQPP
jgi:hypothetical protein